MEQDILEILRETERLIGRLTTYNEWRRGGEHIVPHPKQIGQDIDAAIDYLGKYQELLFNDNKQGGCDE